MAVFLPSLKESGHLEQLHITVCNVGSRKLSISDDYGSKGWGIFAPNLSIYGFDADADACDAANLDLQTRQVNWQEKHLPFALSNSIGEAQLYVTKNPMCSSLYPPNEPYLARLSGLPELVNLDFTLEVETTTLDTVCQEEKITEIDFLQIDVQGADLQVLQGAKETLKSSVLAIQIEVEFSHLYKDQPLFADIDILLRNQGFSLFDVMKSYRPRSSSPIASKTHPGQLLWGDAFYFRDLLSEHPTANFRTPAQIFKLACIADALDFPDYTLELLEYLTLQYGSDQNYNFANNILESLRQFPQILEQGLDTLPVMQRIKNYLPQDELVEIN